MDYALIMAGGAGTRLWPLSRDISPNPHFVFMAIKVCLKLQSRGFCLCFRLNKSW